MQQTAKDMDVNRETVSVWVHMEKTTGNLKRKPLNRTLKKLDPQKLKEYFLEHPDSLGKEAAQYFNVTKAIISTVLRKLKITRKKNFFIRIFKM
jgi:transposase